LPNNLTNVGENLALDWINNVGTPSRPTPFLALGTAMADQEAGTFTEVTNAGAYARQAVTFAAAANGATSNSADVTFPTATGSWGTVTHVAVVTSGTYGGGSVIWVGPLTASKAVGSGDQIRVPAGSLTLALD
jgi:hypothetical protein